MIVKHYDIVFYSRGMEVFSQMDEMPDGDYVRSEDYASLLASHQALVSALEEFVKWYDSDAGVRLPIDEARAALARVKEGA